MVIDIKEYRQASKTRLRDFGLVMAAIIGVGFGLVYPLLFNKDLSLFPWIIALFFILNALIIPKVLRLIYVPWMIFGGILGYINAKLILGLIYYLIFTPVAFIFKILGKDPLQRELSSVKKTYRVKHGPSERSDPRVHMENPY